MVAERRDRSHTHYVMMADAQRDAASGMPAGTGMEDVTASEQVLSHVVDDGLPEADTVAEACGADADVEHGVEEDQRLAAASRSVNATMDFERLEAERLNTLPRGLRALDEMTDRSISNAICCMLAISAYSVQNVTVLAK